MDAVTLRVLVPVSSAKDLAASLRTSILVGVPDVDLSCLGLDLGKVRIDRFDTDCSIEHIQFNIEYCVIGDCSGLFKS